MDGLLGDGFFGAEEFVEAAFLDLGEEGGGHVHVGVEGGFASCELGELGDGCFEVGCVGCEVSVLLDMLDRANEGTRE